MEQLNAAVRLAQLWLQDADEVSHLDLQYLEMLVEYWARCLENGFTFKELEDIIGDSVQHYRALQILDRAYSKELRNSMVLDEVKKWAGTERAMSYLW